MHENLDNTKHRHGEKVPQFFAGDDTVNPSLYDGKMLSSPSIVDGIDGRKQALSITPSITVSDEYDIETNESRGMKSTSKPDDMVTSPMITSSEDVTKNEIPSTVKKVENQHLNETPGNLHSWLFSLKFRNYTIIVKHFSVS